MTEEGRVLLKEFGVADSFSTADPRLERLRELASERSDFLDQLFAELAHGIYREGMADEAAAEVLRRLTDDRIVERLAKLLRDGHLLAARCPSHSISVARSFSSTP